MKTIITHLTFLVGLVLLAPLVTHAQVGPPTLTAGIGQLAFKKGELDTDLILSLVATKQSEAKEELAQRLILDKLECGSFAVYDFVKKSLSILFSDADPNVKKKELLKNAAQLAMVIGIAEAYLLEVRTNKTNSEQRATFLRVYDRWFYGDKILRNTNTEKHSLDESFNLMSLTDQEKGRIGEELKRITSAKSIPFTENSNYFPKVVALIPIEDITLPSLEVKKALSRLDIWKCGNTSSNHILIDLVYDRCLNSDQAKRIGFFQDGISVPGDVYKGFFSKYWRFDNGEQPSDTIFDAFTGIRDELDRIISASFRFFYTLGDLKPSDLQVDSLKAIQQELNSTQVKTWRGRFHSRVEANIKKSRELIRKTVFEPLDEDDKKAISDLLTVWEVNLLSENIERSMYIINEQLSPKLLAISMKGADLGPILDSLDALNAIYLMEEKYRFFDSMRVGNNPIALAQFQRFQQLFGLLNQLDKVETYDVLLKFLVNVGDIYLSETPKLILNRIMKVISQYIVIDKEQNTIQVNVESLGLALYDRFGNQQGRRIGLYLTVGSNFLIPQFPKFFLPKDSTKLQTVQLISEKIGFELKLIDWNRRRSYLGLRSDKIAAKALDVKFRDQQPYFNDLHILVYGSGLLYRLDFLNTEAELNSSLYGVGVGLTFFNGLDLNLSYGRVFNSAYIKSKVDNLFSTKGDFISLSFDIKFAEYLAALARKQKAKNID